MAKAGTEAQFPRKSAARILDDLLEQACEAGASDIHIEPIDGLVRIRVRTDGTLTSHALLPRNMHGELIARIKILANLRIDEHQRPQDGRFHHQLRNGDHIDLRVAITPTYFGEKAVMRLLVPFRTGADLEELGMVEWQRKLVLRTMAEPHGLMLVAGPTGSGKTSTLYTLLNLLPTDRQSVITIEDPIEYAIPAITQIQTNEQVGLTFENGLRSVLRLDPDTIMIGEIRDRETARLAVNAALTGHTVLSSIHTNDASTVLPRLLDLSIEPYLLPSTVRLVIAQRLARRICMNCRSECDMNTHEQRLMQAWATRERIEAPSTHFIGTGCEICGNTGYRGRIGIFEILIMDEDMREAVLDRPSAPALRSLARRKGMTSLMHDGLRKAALGITTLEEVARLSHE